MIIYEKLIGLYYLLGLHAGLMDSSVDLLHFGVGLITSGGVNERGKVIVTLTLDVVDGEANLDHSVNTSGKLRGVLKVEAGGEEGGLVQEPDEVLDGLVALVDLSLVAELLDDFVGRVDFPRLLGDHVAGHGVITESLGNSFERVGNRNLVIEKIFV